MSAPQVDEKAATAALQCVSRPDSSSVARASAPVSHCRRSHSTDAPIPASPADSPAPGSPGQLSARDRPHFCSAQTIAEAYRL